MNSANGKATKIINQTNFSQIMVIYKNTFFYVFCQLSWTLVCVQKNTYHH